MQKLKIWFLTAEIIKGFYNTKHFQLVNRTNIGHVHCATSG